MNFLICDLQFGSTGKGAIAYYLAKRHKLSVAVCAYTPNAGHTAVDGNLRFVHTVLPIAAAVDSVHTVLIGPGAVFDPLLLCLEAEAIRVRVPNGPIKTLIMHPAAVSLISDDLKFEKELIVIGSTMKGTAAANWRRMRRQPSTIIGNKPDITDYIRTRLYSSGYVVKCDANDYRDVISGVNIIVEGAQGYSLSVYHGMYPYVTSRDTTPNQIAADCGLGARYACHFTIVGTARTYPIRVANRHNDEGEMVGWSGPFYPDQKELTWGELGQKPELTTVTKLQRRVATFSREQILNAIDACQPHEVFLNFCNYEKDPGRIAELCGFFAQYGSKVKYLGYGPDDSQILEVADSEEGSTL
jgi:adenylosuccinate synthase